MRVIKYLFLIMFLIPISVFADEVTISVSCDKETYYEGDVMSCDIVSQSDVSYRSFQANLLLDSSLTLNSFVSSRDEIEVINNGADGAVISLKANADYTIPNGTFCLGTLKIKIGDVGSSLNTQFSLESIRVFGGSENNFSDYTVSSDKVSKEIEISSVVVDDKAIDGVSFDDDITEENETADEVIDIDESDTISVNPKTGGISVFIVCGIALLMIVFIVSFKKKKVLS